MQRFMDIDTAWTIANDGAVTVSMKVKRDMNYPELPRFGIRLFLPKEMDQITYCGIGPMESYCDKRIAGSYGLLVTPFLVKKLHGMYKLNLVGYILGTICRGLVIVGAMIGSIPMMLVCSALASFAISPLQGDLTALIAASSEYTYLTQNKRIDGTMFSCSSFGTKLGGGIGTALSGWLLAASGLQ